MKYIVLAFLLLIVGCASEADKEKERKINRAKFIFKKIESTLYTSPPPLTPEFSNVTARIYRGEDTVFDVATRDFRVLIFLKTNFVADTTTPDTIVVDKKEDKGKSRWEDDEW